MKVQRTLSAMRIGAAILLLFSLAATVHAQGHPQELWLHAAQCLATKHFLPPSKAAKLTFGFLLDEKSYPGDRVVYVVKFAASTRTDGLVFVIFLTERDGHQEFNIQNNASFTLSEEELTGVLFADPPLGGVWTQEHIASAIKHIEKEPRHTISSKDIFAANPSIVCQAYTVPKK